MRLLCTVNLPLEAKALAEAVEAFVALFHRAADPGAPGTKLYLTVSTRKQHDVLIDLAEALPDSTRGFHVVEMFRESFGPEEFLAKIRQDPPRLFGPGFLGNPFEAGKDAIEGLE